MGGWETVFLFFCLLVFLSLLLYPLTPESPRWLLAVGKEAEAEKVIKQISRLNSKALPELARHRQTELREKQVSVPSASDKGSILRRLFSDKVTHLLCSLRPHIDIKTRHCPHHGHPRHQLAGGRSLLLRPLPQLCQPRRGHLHQLCPLRCGGGRDVIT